MNKKRWPWIGFHLTTRPEKTGWTLCMQTVRNEAYGPVANDRVYAAFALYEQGLLSKQELIAELKTYKLIDQMLFHTEKALQTLTFSQVKEVRV